MRLLLDECVPRNRFETFVTVDQNVEFQQNVKASGIAVIVLAARTNRLKELLPLAPTVLKKLSAIRPGALERVSV